MRVLPLLLVLCMSCASLQRPQVDPMPATLAEVNRALEGRKAQVHFTDGRVPVRGYVAVGSKVTVVDVRRVRRMEVEISTSEVSIPTSEIGYIEADASLSSGQGVARGTLYGALSGVALGVLWWVSENPDDDQVGIGSLFIVNGAVLGAGIGPIATSGQDWVPVYEAPITRYPDAAFALLEMEETPVGSR
ncbi:MAG: hypothetical protein AAGI52_07905 [Bacteroidota bacterium]